MKIFLVGGAIRDSLLGLPVKDKDWVVVGATSQQMLDAGYQQVGRDFPVFLHPDSHEEYALARTERKLRSGYTGFSCYAAPDVTLEQDLKRRDLTINALAQDREGKIIDIWCGLNDLKNRILRHISSSFVEDPLRVLRVARFAAYYAHLNFRIAHETMTLMKNITASGELEYLTPERVWKETENALMANNPQIYFQILRHCGALKKLFPEIDMLFNIPTPKIWHLQTDMGTYTMMILHIVANVSSDLSVRFATLCYNLNKTVMSSQQHFMYCCNYPPNYIGIQLIERICQRLRIPNEIRSLAKLVISYNDLINNISNLDPEGIIQLFDSIDAWRKPKRVEQIAVISETCIHDNINSKNNDRTRSILLHKMWQVAKEVQTKTIINDGFKGADISKELKKRRIQALINWKNSAYND